MDIQKEKSTLRRSVRERREALSPAYRQEASEVICQRLLALPEAAELRNGAVFSFFPTKGEPQIFPVLEAFLTRGLDLALPRCTASGVMEARRVSDLSTLSPGTYGIPEPGKEAPLIPWGMFSLALIPCLAAGRDGSRLGHGGGYYDRFLTWAPPDMAAVMVCFEALAEDRLPMGPLDIPVPILVTEGGVWRKGRQVP